MCGQACTQARQSWQLPGTCIARPSLSTMQSAGHTRVHTPQPTQRSVTVTSCCHSASGDPAYTAHILPVRGPVLLRDGGDGAFARFDVGGDGRELLWYVLIHRALGVHVEGRQPVVDHVQGVYIVHAHAAFVAKCLGQLRRAAVAAAVGEHHVEVLRLERALSQETPDHRRHLVPVDRRDDADALRGEFTLRAAHYLRYTDKLIPELPGGI